MAIDTTITGTIPQRIVLVDFDWEDADLVPRLVRHPGSSVRLVAGTRADDPGMRLAELCGLPRTTDLADLTREIFDVALVSERSPRRPQIEGLLLALGTPTLDPRAFLEGGGVSGMIPPAPHAPLALHAAAFEDAIGGENFDAIVEQALPDLLDADPLRPHARNSSRRMHVESLEDFPSAEDRGLLESALREAMLATGAGRAELHVGTVGHMEMVVQVGPDDALLKGLVALAIELGTPQVVTSVTGSEEGRVWGAWPFRTAQRRGVVAAAAMPPQTDWSAWQRTVEDLRTSWDKEDRAMAGPAFPMLPDAEMSWLERDEFVVRLELAVDRHRRDGLRFALHRLRFPMSTVAVDQLASELPAQLRDTDCICRPSSQRILLLTGGSKDQFPFLRRRILALWQRVWLELGLERPIPGISDERIEMLSADHAAGFLAGALAWLDDTGA
ncbi:MAG: hypothetical protein HOP12_08060 [Candidatus Eisenbacteria bacterium]|uniref:Uncharacterized protein n=1 Tax=Eiseniibacteriota bacterium TaxID=2212470 RepID=A0A849SYC7_UNCEI|nr:hypothetical protein [Candidatus Eisenbacteria bacterium]